MSEGRLEKGLGGTETLLEVSGARRLRCFPLAGKVFRENVSCLATLPRSLDVTGSPSSDSLSWGLLLL